MRQPWLTQNSLLQLAEQVLKNFDVNVGDPGPFPAIAQSEHMIVWLVDGMGSAVLERSVSVNLLPNLSINRSQLKFHTVQSVFPTTTATALATLAFAAPPAVHGALGYTIFLRARNRRVNLLTSCDERNEPVAVRDLYPDLENVFSRLARHHVRSAVVGPDLYRHSPLSHWLYRDARYAGYRNQIEIPGIVSGLLSQGTRYIFVYTPNFDRAAHASGIESFPAENALVEWDNVFGSAVRLWRTAPSVTLLVTADHGMVGLNRSQVITQADPAASALWSHPWAGERRNLFTALPAHSLSALKERGAQIFPQSYLWDCGWYGGPPSIRDFRFRVLNTAVVLPSGMQFAMDGSQDPPVMLAAHGGITEAEWSIPLIEGSW